MRSPTEKERAMAAKGRRAALILALSFSLWILAQLIGGRLGWPPFMAFAFDIAAVIALLWAMYLAYQIYRQRREPE